MITQNVYGAPLSIYKMSSILKSNDYAGLYGVGFVFFYTDGTYTDYTWNPGTVTDLGNGYKLFEKTGGGNNSKTLDRIDVRVWSSTNRTLDVSVVQVRFENVLEAAIGTESLGSIQYQYNELNEIIRENNALINKTIVYSYDVGENIKSKTEYPYTRGNLGTVTKNYVYAYGDANWKDKLTYNL